MWGRGGVAGGLADGETGKAVRGPRLLRQKILRYAQKL